MMVRGKLVEITAYVITAALGFKIGTALTIRRTSTGFQKKFARFGLTVADHVYDGNRVAAFKLDYQARIQALTDAIGLKQRLIFVSKELLDHVFAAKRASACDDKFH